MSPVEQLWQLRINLNLMGFGDLVKVMPTHSLFLSQNQIFVTFLHRFGFIASKEILFLEVLLWASHVPNLVS